MKGIFNKFLNTLGILLIIAGVLLMGYYAWGKTQTAYFQHQLREDFEDRAPVAVEVAEEEVPLRVVFQEWKPMRLSIPKIDVDYMVLTGGVFDTDLLDKGPVHYEMSDLPSTESGNVAIAGHRAGKWGFFYYLHELVEGDNIYLFVGEYRFTYSVMDVFPIEPSDWSVIHTTETPSLTLTTCGPLNRPATYRLIARAELYEATKVVYE